MRVRTLHSSLLMIAGACILAVAVPLPVACATAGKPVEGKTAADEKAPVDVICPVKSETPVVLTASEDNPGLDRAPRAITMTRPQYPQDAFVKKIEGVVTVEIFIGAEGHVLRARVLQSVPGLDLAAAETTCSWVFEPAIKNGRRVPTIAHAPVRFAIY